jgi:hypothetical protein
MFREHCAAIVKLKSYRYVLCRSIYQKVGGLGERKDGLASGMLQIIILPHHLYPHINFSFFIMITKNLT